MFPVVVLVGRPNVGKSTLFNRLTRTQNALVADFPGLTRDRQYGEVNFNGKPFIIVDTGGIGVDDVAIDKLMATQSAMALDEADIILFVVDGRAGLTGLDETISLALRKVSRPIFLLVNKVEGLEKHLITSDFQDLGFAEMHCISAAHGVGMEPLLQRLTKDFSLKKITQHEDPNQTDAIKIAFIGRPNVGKSTLINRILGEARVVVYDAPGTTRDSISIPFRQNDKDYILIDTAGVRRRSRVHEKIEKFSIIKTLKSIKESHVCLMLLDAKEGVTEHDLHLLGFIIESGRALVIVVNKWDAICASEKERVRTELARRLMFVNFARVKFISALHDRVDLLFKDVSEAYRSATKILSTPILTRILQELVTKHAPPLVNGRRIKLKYAHVGGHNPPVIVIHGNQLESISESYKRYLMNAFIQRLNLFGTPLEITFKGQVNPFKDKKNTLTPRQVMRRQRLMKRVKRR